MELFNLKSKDLEPVTEAGGQKLQIHRIWIRNIG